MKKGQIINIYQKPYTFEDFEGKATLVKLVRAEKSLPKSETWEVHFSEDEPGENAVRTIVDRQARVRFESDS